MSIYAPQIDEDTGEITFPPIKQDDTEAFMHNYLQAMNEINEPNKVNQPWKLLLLGSNDSEELDLPLKNYAEYHYSRDLIKNVDNTVAYAPDYAPNRSTYKYGNTSVYYLEENDIGSECYVKNFQYSIALSGYYIGEDEVEVGDIVYGVGELDPYTRPKNSAIRGVMKTLKEHYEDEHPHAELDMEFLIRHMDTIYNTDDFVWANNFFHPNYYVLVAHNDGRTGIEEDVAKIEKGGVKYGIGDLNPYTSPRNGGIGSLRNKLYNHLYSNDSNPHNLLDMEFLVREPNTMYHSKDMVWISNTYRPNYLVLESEVDGTSGSKDKIEE